MKEYKINYNGDALIKGNIRNVIKELANNFKDMEVDDESIITIRRVK